MYSAIRAMFAGRREIIMLKKYIDEVEFFTIKELLFMIAFSIIFILKGFGVYDGLVAFKIFMPLVLSFIILKYILESHSVKEIICSGCLVVLFSILFFITNNKGYIISVMIFLGMKDISVKKLFCFGAIASIISLMVNYILFRFEINVGDVRIHHKLGGEILRYSLGNSHPNSMHMTYVIMTILVLYSLKDSKRKLGIWNAILMCISILLCAFTLSYTGMILSVLIFGGVCYLYITYGMNNIKAEKMVPFVILAVCIIFSTIVPYLLIKDSVIFEKINRIFHTRISLLLSYFEAYSVSLFPQRINDYSKIWYQLDNSYAELLLETGIIVFCIFIIALIFTINSLNKNNERFAILFIVIQLIGGITDPYLFNSSARNLIIIWMGQCYFEWLYQSDSKNHIEISCLRKIGNISVGVPVAYNRISMNKPLIYKIAFISLIAALVTTICIVSFRTYPQGYGVGYYKFEGGFFESDENIHISTYSDVMDDKSIVIYNVSNPNDRVVYFDTKRMQTIEKCRDAVLTFINTYVIILLVFGFGCGAINLKKGKD